MSSSLIDGMLQLRNAAEGLKVAWDLSQDGWDDAVRNRIGEEQIEPLLQQVEATLVATQQLADVLNAARRHCQDADRPA